MEGASAGPATRTRLTWIDAAKALGMVLVFHGHLMEHFVDLIGPAAIYQRQWIYSFHMPLFFVLSGLVYKERNLELGAFIRRQVMTRLVPVWAFNLIGMLILIASQYVHASPGWIGERGWLAVVQHYGLRFVHETLTGRPEYNILLWFVVCLCVVETWQFVLARWLRRTIFLGLSIAGFALLTFLATVAREELVALYGDRIHWWHVSAATSAMVFYQVGILVSRLGFSPRRTRRSDATSPEPLTRVRGTGTPTGVGGSAGPTHGRHGTEKQAGCLFHGNRPPRSDNRAIVWAWLLAAGTLAITLVSFTRNEVPGSRIVLVKDAFYGHVGWFFLTSLAGSLLVISLGRILEASRVLQYVGQVTMALLCLNGMMDEFLNPTLARWVAELVPGSGPALILAGILCTLLSVAAALPVCWLLERHVPLLLGRHRSAATK